MPTRQYRSREDGTELWGLQHDFHKWKLHERAVGDPLIWHDTLVDQAGARLSMYGQRVIAIWAFIDAHRFARLFGTAQQTMWKNGQINLLTGILIPKFVVVIRPTLPVLLY
jgi:hypothetical protein